jgi:hypothetical protein
VPNIRYRPNIRQHFLTEYSFSAETRKSVFGRSLIAYPFADNRTALTVWNRAQLPDGKYKEKCGRAETASNAQMPGDLQVTWPGGTHFCFHLS